MAVASFVFLAFFSFAGGEPVPSPAGRNGELARAEDFYKRQLWTDAEKAFLACASHASGEASAAGALCGAGLCRLKMRDEKGAEELFERVASDPAAVKTAPDAVASAFDQLHLLLLKHKRRQPREKLMARCAKILPGHVINARLAEREGDAWLEAGAADKAIAFYFQAGAGLSPVGTNAVRLLRPPGSGFTPPPLSDSDAETLLSVAGAKKMCGLALCGILSKRREGWRAEDVRARILVSQKKYAEGPKSGRPC